MKYQLGLIATFSLLIPFKFHVVKGEEYCNDEKFQPLCWKNEAIVMERATYGRMSDTGRCLEIPDELTGMKVNPRFLGCSVNVLSSFDGACSGSSECDISIVEIKIPSATERPCLAGLPMYLEAEYICVPVVQEDRSCLVLVSSDGIHLSSSFQSSSGCGTKYQPWLLEAPSGQQINITLLDFRRSLASRSHGIATEKHRAESDNVTCSQYGYIEDKLAKKNISICTDGLKRERNIYLSKSNYLSMVLTSGELLKSKQEQKYLLRFEAVGCSDLKPPVDAWLKRTDNEATVGCYMTRQTWTLTCHGQTWRGTIGNCTQHSSDIQKEIINIDETTNPETSHAVILAAVVGISLVICLCILALGLYCTCSRSLQTKTAHVLKAHNGYKTVGTRENLQLTKESAPTGIHTMDHVTILQPTSSNGSLIYSKRDDVMENDDNYNVSRDVTTLQSPNTSDNSTAPAQYFVLDQQAVYIKSGWI